MNYSNPDPQDSTPDESGRLAAPISLARQTRSSAPVYRHLHNATSNAHVIAFQSTALFNDADGTPLTLAGLMQRWKVGRPTARAARRTLIDLGYWAEVVPRNAAGETTREIRVWESPATPADLEELALEYHAGTRIECGGDVYRVTNDGGLVSAGRTVRQKTAGRRSSTVRQKTAGRSDQGEFTVRQKTAGRSRSTEADTDPDVSAGRTVRQKTAGPLERERETSRSLSIDRASAAPAPGGADGALTEDALTARLRGLVEGLPWEDYATRTGSRVVITRFDVDTVVAAMRRAVEAGQVDVERAERVARAALARATSSPWRYLASGFSERRLDGWLRQLDVVRVVDPVAAVEQSGGQGQTTPATPPASSAGDWPACTTCGALEGDKPHLRTVDDGAGGLGPCPDCHPDRVR